tara:strand:- start:2728 stop:2940 length:213 start_codon:yes stop_codon:yes gene_type:complete
LIFNLTNKILDKTSIMKEKCINPDSHNVIKECNKMCILSVDYDGCVNVLLIHVFQIRKVILILLVNLSKV